MEKTSARILVVDDDPDVLYAARLFLKQHFTEVVIEKRPESIPFLLNSGPFDVILLDMNFQGETSNGQDGFSWLGKILEIDPAAVVIFITAYGGVETAVKAIKVGATDFVLKPWENQKLLATVFSALKLRQSQQQVTNLKQQQQVLSADLDTPFQDIIGQSAAIRQVLSTVQKVAKTDANVLILGENGTGKEVVARALHRCSRRAGEVFVSVDLGAISESLFESELFGHVKGAFTDARSDRAGRFEVASKGTLFLDEIGNLSLPLQAKLLTALQNRQVTPVGSNRAIPVDIRLICATNQPLYESVERGDFRQDLLYRINTIETRLPPLRERTEDIPLLTRHYLQLYQRKYGKTLKGVSPAALKQMQAYPWPGNVRELQHAIERAVIMSDEDWLQPPDLFPAGGRALLHARPTDATPEPGASSSALDEMEKKEIRKVLQKHDGNVSLTARELGITRGALYRRIRKHGI